MNYPYIRSEKWLLILATKKCTVSTRNKVYLFIFITTLLALAFATSLLNNDDPSQIVYDEVKLREHLIQCHNKGKLRSFPKGVLHNKPIRRANAISISMKLHCACRLPWDSSDKADSEYHMAQCGKCSSWFYRKCAKIPSEVFDKKTQWLCCLCSM